MFQQDSQLQQDPSTMTAEAFPELLRRCGATKPQRLPYSTRHLQKQIKQQEILSDETSAPIQENQTS